MKIALAQINSSLGDFEQNSRKIREAWARAEADGCDLVIFPELALMGYSPNDLLTRPEVIKGQLAALKTLQKKKSKTAAIFGAVTLNTTQRQKGFYNSAVLAPQGELVHKTLLPSYDVFDEARYYQPGSPSAHLIRYRGQSILIFICEDMWGWDIDHHPNLVEVYRKKKIDLVVSINASPFALGKVRRRRQVAQQTSRALKAPLVYVNMVGAQDELIFDGGSFALDQQGKLRAQSPWFEESFQVVDFSAKKSTLSPAISEAETLRRALVLGIRDFANKNGFQKAHLGLSGGIDSAVVLVLAAEALGPQNITSIALPGPYSTPPSLELARQLAKNVGSPLKTIDIRAAYEQHLASFTESHGSTEFGLVHENLQARLRANFLMMHANREQSLLLTTGNKSEYASGYSTLYGDMCGGLAPLGDLLKGQVYELARLYNQEGEVIPAAIIDRAPSAELKPNQKDQDSLPEYDRLDASVSRIVTESKAPKTETDQWLLKKLAQSEFKRWQAPPILRVSSQAFGRGRRFPISNQFYKNPPNT